MAISDTKQFYQLVATCAATENLPTYNLYLNIKVADNATGTTMFKSNYSLELFEPETGKPMGKTVENANERSFVLLNGIRFDKPGNYQLIVKQYNRFDPMPGMKSIRLELFEGD
jgi:gliding motility-associated lipoprotein GldH